MAWNEISYGSLRFLAHFSPLWAQLTLPVKATIGIRASQARYVRWRASLSVRHAGWNQHGEPPHSADPFFAEIRAAGFAPGKYKFLLMACGVISWQIVIA
jgi:hypothetical protein